MVRRHCFLCEITCVTALIKPNLLLFLAMAYSRAAQSATLVASFCGLRLASCFFRPFCCIPLKTSFENKCSSLHCRQCTSKIVVLWLSLMYHFQAYLCTLHIPHFAVHVYNLIVCALAKSEITLQQMTLR